MNRIRRLAEELVQKHPKLFSANFELNKKALGQVAEVRSTLLRNQLAGAITTIQRDRAASEPANIEPKLEETKEEGEAQLPKSQDLTRGEEEEQKRQRESENVLQASAQK